MAKVRFNLHNAKEKETHIRLVYRYPGAHGAALVRNKRIPAGRPGGAKLSPNHGHFRAQDGKGIFPVY